MKNKNLSVGGGLLTIVCSVIISWLIANISVDYDRMEMGALINLLGPFLIGVASLMLFAIVNWIAPNATLFLTIILSLANVLIGVLIRADSL